MFRTNHSPRLSKQLRVEQLEGREVPAIMLAVTGSDHLITFDSANPTAIRTNVAITGLAAGERITDIDVRPATGGLYGLSNLHQLYLINASNGAATQVGTVAGVNAQNVGIDFDPVSDQLRVVSNHGQVLAVNPLDASSIGTGPALSFRAGDAFQGQSPRVTSIAYTNGVSGASSSIQYGIDQSRNALVRISNSLSTGGVVKTVGSLGVDVNQSVGFDIDPALNVGYVTVPVPGSSASVFGVVNLATGGTTLISPIGNNRSITDIAVAVGGNTFTGTTTGTGTIGNLGNLGTGTLGLGNLGTGTLGGLGTTGLGNLGTGTIIPVLANSAGLFNNTGLGTTLPLGTTTGGLFTPTSGTTTGGLFNPTFGTTTGGLFNPTFGTTGLFNPTFGTTTATGGLFGTNFGTTTGSLFVPTFGTATGSSLFAPISNMSVLPATSLFGTGTGVGTSLFPISTSFF